MSMVKKLLRTMKIAVEGCCHGELDAIYSQIARLENQHKYRVNLLLICGDFQAIRNHADLRCIAVPDKYKQLKDFHKYYTGQKTAPILTIVIGGNHEASNYMWELYHGGWLAPNIYFLGHAGSVLVNGIRISGASGIFKKHDFSFGNISALFIFGDAWSSFTGSHEKLPYDASTMRSIYHIREFCVRKLSLLPTPDIFLSHDWPHQIEHYGNLRALLARKNFLRGDIEARHLGSPPLMHLLLTLQPRWWFAAHLHTRYEATVVHTQAGGRKPEQTTGVPNTKNPDEIVIDDVDEDGESSGSAQAAVPRPVRNSDEIVLEDEEEEVAPPQPAIPHLSPAITKFLALDKCLPKRQFLEIIDVEPDPSLTMDPTFNTPSTSNESQPYDQQSSSDSSSSSRAPTLCYDPVWLAITRAFHPYFSTARNQPPFPEEQAARESVETELAWVMKHVPRKLGGWEVNSCQQFWNIVPGAEQKGNGQPPLYPNPQTEAFCSLLEIENKIL